MTIIKRVKRKFLIISCTEQRYHHYGENTDDAAYGLLEQRVDRHADNGKEKGVEN